MKIVHVLLRLLPFALVLQHGASAQSDSLPLAADTQGLERPRFEAVRFLFAMGYRNCDFSALDELIGRSSSTIVPMSVLLGIPVLENPTVTLVSGWGLDMRGGGRGMTVLFSSALLLRAGDDSWFQPVIGLGAEYTHVPWESATFRISASKTCPLFIVGVSIYGKCDLLMDLPFATDVSTTFGGKKYTIQLTGPGVTMQLSL